MNPIEDAFTPPLADTASFATTTFELPPSRHEPPRISEPAPGARRRGRPLEMTPDEVCDEIRRLFALERGLVAIHRRNPGLYARARRQFGSWAAAVTAARE